MPGVVPFFAVPKGALLDVLSLGTRGVPIADCTLANVLHDGAFWILGDGVMGSPLTLRNIPRARSPSNLGF